MDYFIQLSLLKNKYGKMFCKPISSDSFTLSCTIWYAKSYGLSIPEDAYLNLHEENPKSHDMVINYLDNNPEGRAKFLRKELCYFGALCKAEKSFCLI